MTATPTPTPIAIVGCGFVADLYLQTLASHTSLAVVGVFDRDADRGRVFAAHHGLRPFDALHALLREGKPRIVLNLTNPRSHDAITRACLDAGCHVYSEKPLAMSVASAVELVELAEAKGLLLCGAPATVLGEAAQTMWKALREEVVGRPYLVYAEMDEGMLHQMPYRDWKSPSVGVPWPWKDELEVGCTLEHVSYCLTWLCAFFGPARSVTAFSTLAVPDKQTAEPLDDPAADFSVACLTFDGGVSARLTCGIVAPHDHRFMVVGERGILATDDSWDARAKVYYRRRHRIRRRMFLTPIKRRVKPVGDGRASGATAGAQRIDFLRGVADMAEGIVESRPPRLSPRFTLHVNELALVIQGAGDRGRTHTPTTTFEPMQPMDWAKDS